MSDYTYFARERGTDGPVKIGRARDPYDRLQSISWKEGKKMELICAIPFDCERRFHNLFMNYHRGHEWFDWSPLMKRAVKHITLGKFDFEGLPEPKHVGFAVPAKQKRPFKPKRHAVTLYRDGVPIEELRFIPCDENGHPVLTGRSS